MSPAAYLGVRRGDAAALAVSGLALALSVGSAGASSPVVGSAADPSASLGSLVFERVGGDGVLRTAGGDQALPGTDPAIGGPYVAVRDGDAIQLLDRNSLAPVGAPIAAPGTDALAVSAGWLVYRTREGEGDRLRAREISNPAAPGAELQLDSTADPAQLSPPSLDAATVLYAVARQRGSRIVKFDLPAGGKNTLLRSNLALLFNPSVLGDRFVYVRSQDGRSKLMTRTLGGRGQGRTVLKRRDSGGRLWSTALAEDQVYLTLLDPGATTPGAEILTQSLGGSGKKK